MLIDVAESMQRASCHVISCKFVPSRLPMGLLICMRHLTTSTESCFCMACVYSGFYIDKTTSDWGGTKHPRVMLVTQLAGGPLDNRRWFRLQRPHFCGRVVENIHHVRVMRMGGQMGMCVLSTMGREEYPNFCRQSVAFSTTLHSAVADIGDSPSLCDSVSGKGGKQEWRGGGL